MKTTLIRWDLFKHGNIADLRVMNSAGMTGVVTALVETVYEAFDPKVRWDSSGVSTVPKGPLYVIDDRVTGNEVGL